MRRQMKTDSKIFISGHKGLVGSSLVRKLTSEGYFNLVLKSKLELDLRDQGQTRSFFEKEKFDYVFLSAAKVGGIEWNNNCPADFIYDNLQIQNNVIHFSYKTGVKKLMFLGSACIYPKITPQPIKEEYLLTAPLEPTNEGYSLAKIAGLKMCQFYKKQYGFEAISLMPANLYGEYDNFNKSQSHVIPALIRKFVEAKEKGLSEVVCYGDGSPTREFLYSGDFADSCLYLMKNYSDSDIINVGSNEEITIKRLAELIKKYVGFEGSITWDTTKPNGTPLRRLCLDKLNSLGWNSTTTFEQGIQKTIDWYLQNKETYERNSP